MSASDPVDVLPGAILRQLVEWGYPQGARRATPAADDAFSVIHITGNSRLPSADGEISWRQNDPALQNSATFFVDRDGGIRQALGDPLHMAPWSNGDLNQPDRSNPRIARCVRQGVNPNMRTLVSIENVGYEPGDPLTDAQVRSNAKIIAYFHSKAGVPIRRETVVGHYQINSVSRPNCPGRDKSVIDRIVELAREMSGSEEDNVYWKEVAARRLERLEKVKAERDALAAEVAELEAIVAELEAIDVEAMKRTINRLRRRIETIKSKVAALAVDVEDD